MIRMKKFAAMTLGTLVVSGVCAFGSMAAATGISAVDFGSYSSFAPSAAGTVPAADAMSATAAMQTEASMPIADAVQTEASMPASGISTPGFSADDALDELFRNSVIVGNSIGNGFALYTKKHTDDPVLKNFQSLTANGFYIEGAFEDISSTSRHPFYMGQQRYVWDAIQLMGAKHVFLSFGTTEVQYPSVLEDYQRLINQIKAVNPDVDITVISATYIYPGKYYGTMTSANVKKFNTAMEQICAANGWGFINVADLLADANGDLNPIYSSDEYIHQNDLAYDIWTNSLKEYGLRKLGLA